MLGARGDEGPKSKPLPGLVRLGEIFERLQGWLLLREREPVKPGDAVEHRTLRIRRLRALLHVVDADAGFGEERGLDLRDRRLRALRVLLARSRDDAPSWI